MMQPYISTGLTHVTELASKHAKGRAPHTSHGSAADWQRQQSGDKGNVDQWEGDLLVLAIGNAQQAGESSLAAAAVSQPVIQQEWCTSQC